MPIWIDADACPKVCRDMLLRAGERLKIELNFVANHALPLPRATWCRQFRVEAGFDVADNLIATSVRPGDLVMTQDIPLAAICVEQGATVLTPRGDKLDKDNVKARLAVRNLQEELRGAGMVALGVMSAPSPENARVADGLTQSRLRTPEEFQNIRLRSNSDLPLPAP